MASTNPFVYGEVVPTAAFVDREVELDRLTRDLLAGQKVFLISPRRYGKSSLVRQALAAVERRRRADGRGHRQQLQLLRRLPRGLRAGPVRRSRRRLDRARALAARHARRRAPRSAGRAGQGRPPAPSPSRSPRPAPRATSRGSREEVFALPGRIAEARRRPLAVALDEFQAIASFEGDGKARDAPGGARAARGRPAPAPGRLRLRRFGADADGARCSAEAARSTRPGR